MGYLTRLLDMAAGAPDAADDYWYEPRGTLAGSGVNVTADVALTVSAVFACVRVLAETVGSLPLVVYRRDGEDRKTRARGQRIYEILHDQPNGWMSSLEWREMMTGHCALRGNAYSWIQDGVRGAVDELIPLHPDRMEAEQLRSRRLRYHYTWPWGERQTFVQDEIYHLRGLSSDGITGLSVVSYARETIGLALASEGYAARMFLNDARPGGVLEHPGELSDGAHKRILASWQEDHGGWRNRGKPAIFEEGMKWHQIGMTGEDSQYILSRQFSVTEVARWFRMPPHLIQELTRSTFSNIEHQGLEFVIYTMMPWFRRWEQAIGRDLITSPDLFAEFLVDALLRGDTLSRYQAYGRGILDGWLTRNEARIKENLEPLPGLDTPLVPLNMGPAGAAPLSTGDRAMDLALAAAERILRKEGAAIAKAQEHLGEDLAGWARWAAEFYGKHAGFVAEAMAIPQATAMQYAKRCEERIARDGVAGFDLEDQRSLLVGLATFTLELPAAA